MLGFNEIVERKRKFTMKKSSVTLSDVKSLILCVMSCLIRQVESTYLAARQKWKNFLSFSFMYEYFVLLKDKISNKGITARNLPNYISSFIQVYRLSSYEHRGRKV